MRTILASLVLFAAVALLAGGAGAGEKGKGKGGKEVTLKGSITCGKCDLGKDKACATVIVVKAKDSKETVYYFDAASHKKHHAAVCNEAKPGSVTGTVKTEGEKKVIAVKDLKFN